MWAYSNMLLLGLNSLLYTFSKSRKREIKIGPKISPINPKKLTPMMTPNTVIRG